MPTFFAIIGTKDSGVIPGCVLISKTYNFFFKGSFSLYLKSVRVIPLHPKYL